MTRRDSLIAMLAAARAVQAGPRRPLDGENMYRDLATYSSLGEHRTATAVDARTSEWLAEEMHTAGYRTRMSPFTVQQFFPSKTELTVAGQPVKSFPMWWPRPTGPKPVQGALGSKIAVIKLGDVKGAKIVPG